MAGEVRSEVASTTAVKSVERRCAAIVVAPPSNLFSFFFRIWRGKGRKRSLFFFFSDRSPVRSSHLSSAALPRRWSLPHYSRSGAFSVARSPTPVSPLLAARTACAGVLHCCISAPLHKAINTPAIHHPSKHKMHNTAARPIW